MDTKLLTPALYSGSVIPGGGPFKHTAPVSPAAAKTLVAALPPSSWLTQARGATPPACGEYLPRPASRVRSSGQPDTCGQHTLVGLCSKLWPRRSSRWPLSPARRLAASTSCCTWSWQPGEQGSGGALTVLISALAALAIAAGRFAAARGNSRSSEASDDPQPGSRPSRLPPARTRPVLVRNRRYRGGCGHRDAGLAHRPRDRGCRAAGPGGSRNRARWGVAALPAA